MKLLVVLLIISVMLVVSWSKEVYWATGEPDNYKVKFGLEKNWRNPMRIRALHEEELYDKWHDSFVLGQEAKSKANFADIYSSSIANFNKMNDLAFYLKSMSNANGEL